MAKPKYEIVKAWRARNKDKVAAQARRRQLKHSVGIAEQQKAWRDRNRERLRPIEAARARNRRRVDPEGAKRRTAAFKARTRAKQELAAGRPCPEACEICAAQSVRIVYDHCHASGLFRGWLCDRCNRTLGQVRDDSALLRDMANYLEATSGAVDEQAT